MQCDRPDSRSATQRKCRWRYNIVFHKRLRLVALATGKKARMLQEFRSQLAEIDAASIYHHFWGGLLLPRFEEREYNNDFAAWIRHGIHDAVLAERLAALAPTSFPDLEALRREIIELIDTRMDEMEHLIWARATGQFEFICSQIVVFDAEGGSESQRSWRLPCRISLRAAFFITLLMPVVAPVTVETISATG